QVPVIGTGTPRPVAGTAGAKFAAFLKRWSPARLTIAARLGLSLMLVVLVLGTVLIFFVRNFVFLQLTRHFQVNDMSVVLNLSENCVEPLLTDNPVALHTLIRNAQASERDFTYIYVLNRQGQPVVHTFEKGFPVQLPPANPLGTGQEHRVQRIDTGKEVVREIAVPLLDGRLGSLHVGVSQSRVRRSVDILAIHMAVLMALIVLAGLYLTHYLARRALAPLIDISRALKAVGAGNLSCRVAAQGENEVSELTASFNEMTEKLEHARRELQVTQMQLLQSSKMATMGQFAAGIAHEINNPLGAIVNFVRAVLVNPEIQGQNRGYLELSLKGLFKIENIIRQILRYSAKRNSEPKFVSVNQLLHESLAFMNHKLTEKNISVEFNGSRVLPEVLVDPSQIQQIFINIISNAIDAMEDGGKLAIETVASEGEQQIKFTDNGKGIMEKDLNRIFDPFFTTKDVGKGTGLGLFISYNIIRLYQGTITIASTEGKGTTVAITLPLSQEKKT
ncbi:MAG: HAMP domain-containing sensor histidine kinase, partial [Endomicrobiales bacterium]